MSRRGRVSTHHPPWRRLAAHTLSRLPEECSRARCRMVHAVGLAIRDVGPSRSLGLQSRFLDIYSGKSIERLSEPLSRSLRSGRKSRGFGKRRRPVHLHYVHMAAELWLDSTDG